MSTPDKPFLTWDKQLLHAQNEYNLEVNDPQDYSAIQFLSYYDLMNGYQRILMTNNGKFRDGTDIQFLARLCQLERKFRGELISYAGIVETAFKNILAYVLSENFGVFEDDYLDLNNYAQSRSWAKNERLRNTINDLRYSIAKSDDQPTKHYRINKNHVPPWIALKNATFSQATTLFQSLKSNHKNEVISYFRFYDFWGNNGSRNIDAFQSALKYIRKYRNLAAHNLNFTQYNNIELDASICRKLNGTLLTNNQATGSRTGVLMFIVALFTMLESPNSPAQFLGTLYPILNSLDRAYLNAINVFEDNLDMFLDVMFPNGGGHKYKELIESLGNLVRHK